MDVNGSCFGSPVPVSPLKERNERLQIKRKGNCREELTKSPKKRRISPNSYAGDKENDDWGFSDRDSGIVSDCDLLLLEAAKNAENSCTKMEQSGSEKITAERHDNEDLLDIDGSMFDDMLFSEEESSFTAPESKEETLNLSGSEMCYVVQTWKDPEVPVNMFLQLRSCETNRTAVCQLRPPWSSLPVKEGDVVSIIGAKYEKETWYLDLKAGILVHHSDLLVSGTSVVGSLFCRRRAVLAEWFRGVDVTAACAVIGSLVHTILQEVLQNKIQDKNSVEQLVMKTLENPDNLRQLLLCGLSSDKARAEIMPFVPRIVQFVSQHVTHPHKNRGLAVTDIEDVEENIWSPRLGVKGKIDVTVKMKSPANSSQLAPLELKTGRATASSEHRGQVMLYILMLQDLGYNVNKGLLLYLRDDVSLMEIPFSHPESRDLIQLRNELANNLRTAMPSEMGQPPVLPKPISRTNGCSKCPYLIECSAYQRATDPSHPLLEVGGAAHLSEESINYFLWWTGLLGLEEAQRLSNSKLADLWKLSAADREKRGSCASELSLEGKAIQCGSVFRQRLVVSNRDRDLTTIGGLAEGDFVLVSSNLRIAVTTGTIDKIDPFGIDIILNRDLRSRHYGDKFHIDVYESQSSLSYLMTNLGLLMDNTEAAAKLRSIVVDRAKPEFSSEEIGRLSGSEKTITQHLNIAQLNAIRKSVASRNYLLICGMPGTGKTEMLASLVRVLVGRGASVLITSNTHSAVDNLLLRLKKHNLPILRLGSEQRIHPELRCFSEAELSKGCKTPEELTKRLNSRLIVGSTCLGTNSPLLTGRRFSVCLVDESTQTLQVMLMRPLLLCERFILVGDPQQLPPVVTSLKARQLGLDESLFTRLDGLGATVILDLQYRMNRAIVKLANHLAYGGRLRCANADIANATLRVENIQKVPQWMSRIVSPDMSDAVLFVDTGVVPLLEENSNKNGRCTNIHELALLAAVTSIWEKGAVDTKDIGIIAPFRAQVNLIRKALPSHEVNTVDQFQGRDKSVILLSCTRSKKSIAKNSAKDNETASLKKEEEDEIKDTAILDDIRRLTVAVTRAKHKLVMFGDRETLRHHKPFFRAFELLDKKGLVLSVHDNSKEFLWKPLVENVFSELGVKSKPVTIKSVNEN
ncbi:DNA replication ATP-dependent helicase/nuclease DNA2-like isoform X1 [Schistocerca americana]|uniref:DNA replication ATP-dependent helicase/nuclease DNA2-like isoform X1 n=1 Tax=Schistocerca americana TaxID=7009 RepID=UPI001F4F74BC|nr:DNA replication ATP-dependent helicase/nuclease DNA2-like isoform X1 [Schistocerca americana]